MTVLNRVQSKARSNHRCALCGKIIFHGQEYIRYSIRNDGGVDTIKQHIHCDAIENWYMGTENGMNNDSFKPEDVENTIREEICKGCGKCKMRGYYLWTCDRVIKRTVPPSLHGAALESAVNANV